MIMMIVMVMTILIIDYSDDEHKADADGNHDDHDDNRDDNDEDNDVNNDDNRRQ